VAESNKKSLILVEVGDDEVEYYLNQDSPFSILSSNSPRQFKIRKRENPISPETKYKPFFFIVFPTITNY